MNIFILICAGLGITLGLLEAWTNNQKKLQNSAQTKEQNVNSFNSKSVGIILIVLVTVLGVLAFFGFSNLGKEDLFTGNKKYEEIAIEYFENVNKDYLSYMTLVDTSSYSLDKEVRVTLKYRFTEGPNISYSTYTLVIDKDTKQVIGFNKY